AFVVPLAHTAVVRVLLPRVVPDRRPWRRRSAAPAPGARWEAPDSAAIAAGWAVHTRDAARVELPDPALGEVVAASQRSLVLAAGDGFLDDAAGSIAVCEALALSGLT